MKQLRILFLLLVAIVTQGAWAALPDGCTVMSQELHLGTNEGIVIDWRDASNPWNSTNPADFNLYKFVPNKHFALKVEVPEYSNVAIFDKDGTCIYDEEVSDFISTFTFEGNSLSVDVENGSTYYIGFRSINNSDEWNHYVRTINLQNDETVNHSLTHYEGNYNCIYGGNIEYWECDCGNLYADADCMVKVEDSYKEGAGSHNFDFTQGNANWHCQNCSQVVHGSLSVGDNYISTEGFNDSFDWGAYYLASSYIIYRFIAPKDGRFSLQDITTNPKVIETAVFSDEWEMKTSSELKNSSYSLEYNIEKGQELFIGIRAKNANTPLVNERFKISIKCENHSKVYVGSVEPTCEHSGIRAHYVCEVCGTMFDTSNYERDESFFVLQRLSHRLYNGECKDCHTQIPTYELGEYQIPLDHNYINDWDYPTTLFRVHSEKHGLLSIQGHYQVDKDNSNISIYLYSPSEIEEKSADDSNNGGGVLSAPRKATNKTVTWTSPVPADSYYYVMVYHDDETTATFNFSLEEHEVTCIQEHVEPTCIADGSKAVYRCTSGCGFEYTEDGIKYPSYNDKIIPALSHIEGANGLCTMCGHKIILTDGDNDVQFLAGNVKATIFKFTATETGSVELAVVTNANILHAGIYPWGEDDSQNGGTPASAPRKAASVGDPTNPYTVSGDVVAGNEYSVVFTTSEYNETPASVNVSYYNVYVDGENVDLATVMTEHPYAKGLSFGWNANITSCTITKDMMLNLEWGTTFVGQLKIGNGAKVEINGGGNLSFRNMSEGSFSVIVENGDLTCNYIDNFNYNYNNGAVLVKKGSFTANGGRIHGTEAIVARKSLGSTDDVAINVINGAEVWGTKLAIYMDVNGHLTIDNPGTYQGIQGDDQSIVAKAGTIDLSNIQENVIRTNGPVGSDIGVRIPVVHENSIPYLDGVPAVAMQIGTAEEGFTGTTVLRMRNVTLVPSNLNGYGETNGIDFQKVLVTGSAAHPTRYYLTNVQGEEQIVVENAQYVETMEPIVVEDGENDNVHFPDGEAQLTVLKFTATESRYLEVSAATDATIENCFIMPWEEWDVSSVANDNNIQYARRKANAIGSAEPAGNVVAMTKVTEGNTYAIIFTTSAATKTPAVITLSYSDYPVVTVGENIINIDDVDGDCYDDDDSPNVDSSCYNVYKYIATKTGKVHFYTYGGKDTFCLLFDKNFNYLTDEDGTSDNDWMDFDFTWSVEEGETYYLGVRSWDGYSIGEYPLVIEIEGIPEFEGTLELATVDGDNVTENELPAAIHAYFNGVDPGLKSPLFIANGGVTYKRAATSSKWGTVVLPYELESNDNIAYYELTAADISNAKLEFTKVAKVAPNTPTVFRIISGNQYDASVEGPVTIEIPEDWGDFDLGKWCDVGNDDVEWWLDGWYYEQTIDVNNDSYFFDDHGNKKDIGIMYISGDKFYHATGTVTVKPYRAIFEAYGVDWSSSSSSVRITFKDDNGIMTTIESIMEENGEFTDVEAIYDLNGRQRNSIRRGVNIVRTADGRVRKFVKK